MYATDEQPDFATETKEVARCVASATGYEPIAVDLFTCNAYAAVKVVGPGLEMRITRSIPRPRRSHG